MPFCFSGWGRLSSWHPLGQEEGRVQPAVKIVWRFKGFCEGEMGWTDESGLQCKRWAVIWFVYRQCTNCKNKKPVNPASWPQHHNPDFARWLPIPLHLRLPDGSQSLDTIISTCSLGLGPLNTPSPTVHACIPSRSIPLLSQTYLTWVRFTWCSIINVPRTPQLLMFLPQPPNFSKIAWELELQQLYVSVARLWADLLPKLVVESHDLHGHFVNLQ